jgi:hypothetical protein
MQQFGLRYLYKHLGQALKQIPFEITNHNRVIAVVKPSDFSGDINLNDPLTVEEQDGKLHRHFESGKIEVYDPITSKWKQK